MIENEPFYSDEDEPYVTEQGRGLSVFFDRTINMAGNPPCPVRITVTSKGFDHGDSKSEGITFQILFKGRNPVVAPAVSFGDGVDFKMSVESAQLTDGQRAVLDWLKQKIDQNRNSQEKKPDLKEYLESLIP